jgi:hypothetical protein
MDKEYQVNSIKIILILSFIILVIQDISSNPIPSPVMNEIKFNSNGFILEIIDSGMFTNLDGCFLTSKTDTAYFKPGVPGNIDFFLITQDSLLSPLSINPAGDELSFHSPTMGYVETITFGDSNICNIGAPLASQSICLNDFGGPYYLDNTPTLGLPNDYTNATGTLEGFVTNLAGDTLSGVKIFRKYGSPVYTNSSGYFSFEELSIFEELLFHKTSYPDGYLWLQIWPDSIQMIHVIIENLVGIKKEQPKIQVSDFQLFQNYPNPFNPETIIEYYLPQSATIRLEILNLLGQKVRTLVAGQRPFGNHWTLWDGKDDSGREVASGVYIYRLVAGKYRESRKMMMLK